MEKSKTTIAIPPGATIKEQLEDRKMTQKEFAHRMDLSEKHVSKLINGEVQLTNDVALRLEFVLGIPARFWNNLESLYREKLAKVRNENQMELDVGLMKKFPYREMAKNGWVPNSTKSAEKVFNLRKFFGVSNLGLLCDPYISGIACRRLGENEKADFALLAWAQQAQILARDVHTEAINLDKLIEIVPEIKKMTVENPQIFCKRLINLFAICGVALVFLPHIGGSFLHGATFYSGDKIVMGLTVRGGDADRFWFSLFHEMAHIIHGHIGKVGGPTTDDEKDADAFAREVLIPQNLFDDFIQDGDFSKESIVRFAKKANIAPGIVVGRLQKERYIDYSRHNDLKIRYAIVADNPNL